MAEEMDEDQTFPQEEVQRCMQEACESVLETAQWEEEKVPGWINEVIEKAMKSLSELKTAYKFIVTCMMVQKTDKALFSCASTNWENSTDGIESFVYPPTRNKEAAGKTIQCLITCCAMKF